MEATNTSRAQRAREVANIFAAAARDPIQKLRQRRARVAAHLSAMLAVLDISHAKISQKSGIKPSQLSRQLAGDANLTLDTISRICDAAGADYDIVFRRAGDKAAPQFWEAKSQVPPTTVISHAKFDDWLLGLFQGVQHHGGRTPAATNMATTVAGNDASFNGEKYVA